MSRSLYENGKVRCSACKKWIDPILDLAEISFDSLGRLYHKSMICPVRTMYPQRLRSKSTYQKTKLEKRQKATYY